MPFLKKLFISILSIAALVAIFPQTLLAARSSYYDYGPYYGSQVLGFSFSVLENLPAPEIPDNLMPKPAGGILPDSPFAFWDRVTENVQLTFTFDPAQKEQLRWEQALERLEEAKTLIDQAKTEAALRAASDYHQTVITLTENLDKLPAEAITKIEEQAAAHTVLSQGLSFGSSPATVEVWNLSLEASQGLLDKVADVGGQSPLPEGLSTGIQALKQQGLISEEESNKIYGFKSRAEVREELEKLALSGQFPLSEMAKLDVGVNAYYPDIQKQNLANLQVAELQNYQSLPQPSKDVITELNRWEQNQGITPPNNIKPYLWYNRAQDLVEEVDLSNFSPDQQGEVARFYPNVANNPTYTPSKSGTAEPSPASPDASLGGPSPSPIPSPSPTPASVNYLGDAGGALPGDPTYFFKQFGENLSLTFTVSETEKSRLRMQFAERRLAEAHGLSGDPKKAAQYADALQRYQDAVLGVTEYIEGISDEKVAKEAAERWESQAARHEIALEKGILPPPPQKPELISNAIKATEGAMDQAADSLERPALPPSLASRLDDLKTQGLILSEEAQDLINSSSRQEVREKIRKLTEIGSFPSADAKKLDEAQGLVSSSDYNQLVEVRKVEELQNLRSVQTELAQTPTLKINADALTQREKSLIESIDISLIKPEDLLGRDDLKAVYDKLAAENPNRPVNRGQFGAQAPAPADVVLTACPEGATFKAFEGCVWADSGKKLNDYEQYRCDSAGQYYSFAARKCVPYEKGKGFGEDASPICPVGYTWAWQIQSCQASTGGTTPKPTPTPTPTPIPTPGDDKSCPQGSSYQAPNGCVWDRNGKRVNDTTDSDYRCPSSQYYSFKQFKCVSYPKPGEKDSRDYVPACPDPNTYWSWSDGRCTTPKAIEGGFNPVDIPQPTFVPPDNPFYFVKGWGETLQKTFAFTPQASTEVRLAQAKERLAEAAYALKKDDKEGVKKAISAYISVMQATVADVSREGLSEGAKSKIAKSLSEESVEQNLMLSKLTAWAKEEQDAVIKAATSMPILGVDKAADVLGEPSLPDDIKAKIESLPAEMISEENKKKLLETDSRVEARTELINLSNTGGLTGGDVAFLNDDFDAVDVGSQVEVEELEKLAQIADITDQQDKISEKVEKNEDIAAKISEFRKNFEPGKEIDPAVRPYVRLTRIDEVTQTVRPDVVRLEDFQNRKDVLLAVATLQQEYKPTREAIRQVEDFRRRNPNAALPYDLARIEALSFSLGVRNEAGSCYLPPPFAPNTPCPAPGAAVPITSYYTSYYNSGPNIAVGPYESVATDKDGKPYSYGQGPSPKSAGVCPDGYHWMYDSGGWCMSNGGSYGSSYNYTPSGTGPGYTPYSPYYTAPGVPPGTYGINDSNFRSLYNPLPGGPVYNYVPPSYYGPAPTYYTTNPPAGTVPGSGPKPTSPGQCPSGYHWMSDSGGWCMADGNAYVPAGTTTTPWCWSAYFAPGEPSCASGSFWDSSSCSCRSSSTPSSPSGPYTPSYPSYPGSPSYPSYPGSPSYPSSSCYPPSGGCGSGYFDYGSCSCKQASSQGCYNVSASSCGSGFYWDAGACTCRSNTSSSPTSTSGSCPSGSHWMSDNGGYCMSDNTGSGSSGGGSSSGSCPSGYHWMSDSGGWCMSDGGASVPSSSPSPAPSSSPAPAPSSEPAPAPSSSPAPAPSSEPAPSSSPAPSPSP